MKGVFVKQVRTSERFWGAFAHMPIIAMIWVSYLIYTVWPVVSVRMLLLSAKALEESSTPILPLLLTGASFPILMFVRKMHANSAFVKNNTLSACAFNTWLLKVYGVLGIIAAVGFCLPSDIILTGAAWSAVVVSAICMQQAFFGVCAAINGHVYEYWYPLQALSSGYVLLCQSRCTASDKESQKRKRYPKTKDTIASNTKNKKAGK